MDAPGNNYEQSVPIIDFSFLVRVLRRRLRLIGLVVVACVALALVFASAIPKVYSTSASIVLDTATVSPLGNQTIYSEQSQSNPVVESQIQILRAPYLLSRVVTELNLADRPAFMQPAQTRLVATLNGWVTAGISAIGLNELLPSSPSETDENLRFQKAIQKLRDGLQVSRSGLTLVLSIKYTSSSPSLSAEIVNAVANAYIADQRQIKQQSASDAAEWLRQRVAEINKQAVQAENKLAAFKQENKIVSGGREGLVSEQQVSAVTSQLAQASASRLDAEHKLQQLERLTPLVQQQLLPLSLPGGLSNSSLAELNNRYAGLKSEYDSYVARYGADHPATIKIADELKPLEISIQSALENEQNVARADLLSAAAREAAIRSVFDSAVSDSQKVDEALVRERALESEARVYRELHDTYLQNLLQTVQQESYPTTEARIIGEATPPEFASGPSTKWTILVAAIVGVALGTVLAFALELLDKRIRTRARFAEVIGAPVLGILPNTFDEQRADPGMLSIATPHRLPPSSGEGRINLPQTTRPLLVTEHEMTTTIEQPLSTYAETVRRIKTAVNEIGGRTGSIVGFVSDMPTPRRSVVATNYAEMLALGGARTLLIDADWRHMFLSRSVTPAANQGLADMLLPTDETTPESILWYDERTALQFLPNRKTSGPVSLDPAVFDVDRMRALLKQLLSRYDNIVVDFSDLSGSSTAAALSDILTGVVVVALWGETSASKLSLELERSGIPKYKIIGGVLDGATFEKLDEYESAS